MRETKKKKKSWFCDGLGGVLISRAGVFNLMTELAFLGNVGMVSDCLLCSFHSLYFGCFFWMSASGGRRRNTIPALGLGIGVGPFDLAGIGRLCARGEGRKYIHQGSDILTNERKGKKGEKRRLGKGQGNSPWGRRVMSTDGAACFSFLSRSGPTIGRSWSLLWTDIMLGRYSSF